MSDRQQFNRTKRNYRFIFEIVISIAFTVNVAITFQPHIILNIPAIGSIIIESLPIATVRLREQSLPYENDETKRAAYRMMFAEEDARNRNRGVLDVLQNRLGQKSDELQVRKGGIVGPPKEPRVLALYNEINNFQKELIDVRRNDPEKHTDYIFQILPRFDSLLTDIYTIQKSIFASNQNNS